MGSLDPTHGRDIMALQINSNLLGINIYQDLLYGSWDFEDQHRLPFEVADLDVERGEGGPGTLNADEIEGVLTDDGRSPRDRVSK